MSFARAVWAEGKGEEVRLVAEGSAAIAARELAPFATIVEQPLGDIWLRDTGPIIVRGPRARRRLELRLQRLGAQI